jgi:aspartate kinase
VVVGVASEKDVLLVVFDGSEDGPSGRDGGLLEALDVLGVAGKQLHVTAAKTTLLIARENLHEEDRMRQVLRERFGERCRIEASLGAVSVIGAGINATFETVRRGTSAIASLGASPALVATSSFRVSWLLDRAKLDEAVRTLHGTFIEQSTEPVP